MSRTEIETEQGRASRLRLWGPFSFSGLAIAILALAADQAHKYWMIESYRIAERGRVEITPFLDLVMIWNHGISYGLLQQGSPSGRLLLMVFSVVAVGVLFLWMSNSASRLVAVSLGFVIGGALGNIADRIMHGAVADFFSFHYAGWYWYVFNIADVAITAGVIGLIIDWMVISGAPKVRA
jgi:signal peptidase II